MENSLVTVNKLCLGGIGIGDTVYFIRSEARKIPRRVCGVCDDKGEIKATVNGNVYDIVCPACDNSEPHVRTYYTATSGEVTNITIIVTKDGIETYPTVSTGQFHRLHPTIEEAQKEAYLRNLANGWELVE